MELTLEKVLELGFKEIERKPLAEPLPMPVNYTKEISLYVARRLDIELTEDLFNKLKEKTNYIFGIKDAFKMSVKNPPYCWLAMLGITSGISTVLVPEFWPLIPFLLGLSFLARALCYRVDGSYVSKKGKVYICSKKEGASRIENESHEFTHFFQDHLGKIYKNIKKTYDKDLEWAEGIAMVMHRDALYDYGFKDLADSISLYSLLRVYATLNGGWNSESRQLFNHCYGLIHDTDEEKKFKIKSLKEIERSINIQNKNEEFIREWVYHEFGYARTLIEMETGRTLIDILRQGFTIQL